MDVEKIFERFFSLLLCYGTNNADADADMPLSISIATSSCISMSTTDIFNSNVDGIIKGIVNVIVNGTMNNHG